MATVVDLLRKLGKRASGEANAFAGPVVLPGAPAGAGAADAASLAQAGSRSSVAVVGHGAPVQASIAGAVVTRLQALPGATALWIAADRDDSAAAAMQAAAREAGISVLQAAGAPRILPARLVLATPAELHLHLLRAHDRAWRWLWPRLALVAVPQVHRYAGTPAAHLRWLLRRVARLRANAGALDAPAFVASLAPVTDADATLAAVTDRGRLVHGRLRVVRLDDRPPHNTLVGLWRCGPDRRAELERLTAELATHKLQADVLDRPDATPGARPAGVAAAHVAIAPRVPCSAAERSALLRCGYRLLVLLAGDEPHELFYAAHPERLADGAVAVPDAGENPYVAAPQLCCAAAELPLGVDELDRWGAVELRDRLANRGAILALPGDNAWHAADEPPDPYGELDPRAVGGEPYVVAWADGRKHGLVPPLLVERIARRGAVLATGLRVVALDEDARSITIEDDATAVATMLATSSDVAVRDELEARVLKHAGVDLTRGRVTITQRILALRDLHSDGTQRRVSIQPPHEMQWSAAACWLKLPFAEGTRPADPATVGWSLAYSLPLLMLARPEALTTAYDEERRVLYLVETEPGGTGVAAAVYEQFEQLVDRARELAVACSQRPAWERLAASEAAVLAALAGAREAQAAATGNARVYAGRWEHEAEQNNAEADANNALLAALVTGAEVDEPKILQFPTRTQRDEHAEDRAAYEQPRRRPAVYDAPPVRTAAELVEPLAAAMPEQEAPVVFDELARQAQSHTSAGARTFETPAAAGARTFETPAAGADPPVPAPAGEHSAAESSASLRNRERHPVEAPMPPAAAGTTSDAERKPDVRALIERMRRLRQEREAQQHAARARPAEDAATTALLAARTADEPRFHIGQHVQCLPYGTGTVRSSRRQDDRELVLIDFPDYGEIEVDSSVSLVRPADDPAAPNME